MMVDDGGSSCGNDLKDNISEVDDEEIIEGKAEIVGGSDSDGGHNKNNGNDNDESLESVDNDDVF